MRVKDLIEILKVLDQEKTICVYDYDFDEIEGVSIEVNDETYTINANGTYSNKYHSGLERIFDEDDCRELFEADKEWYKNHKAEEFVKDIRS